MRYCVVGHFVTSEAGHNDLSNDLFIVMEVRYEDRGGPSGVLVQLLYQETHSLVC
jgi:hypothetical protein